MTNSLLHRFWQHRAGEVKFTNKYRIHPLVSTRFKYVINCITRETELKKMVAKKVALIESINPTWDLAENWGKPIKPLHPEDPRSPWQFKNRFLRLRYASGSE